MTTTDRSGHNGASAHKKTSERNGSRRARSPVEELGDLWPSVRKLPRVFQARMKSHPATVVAGVGATAFVLGALCGSRVGRLVMTTLADYGLRQLIEGPLAREVTRFATDAAKRASDGA